MVINLLEILKSLSLAMDFINKRLNNHHIEVTIVSYFIGKERGLRDRDMKKLITASLLHDIGGFSLKERADTLNFEMSSWNKHDIIGSKILQDSEIFSKISPIIANHHKDYKQFNLVALNDEDFLLSQIINIADRFSILSKKLKIQETIKFLGKFRGRKFLPEVYDSLKRVSKKDIFIFELKHGGIRFFEEELKKYEETLDHRELMGLFHLFSKIIDFKSPFTCAHSSGIADIAENLGKEIGLNGDDINALKYAGLVHDIGKVGIPSELINKRGKLTATQYARMKTHIYYSCKILKSIHSFDKIYDYAVHHHERLDGSGYPFGYKKDDLSIGAKIMAVSDVYMALREDRPYRKGLEKLEVKKIMNKLVKSKKLCGEIVSLLFNKSLFDDFVEKNKSFRKSDFSNIMA